MTNVKMSDVIAKLSELSGQNLIEWKTAASKTTFIAVFGDISVLISHRPNGLDGEIKLSVLDEKGDEIEFAEYGGFRPSPYPELRYLYQSAKHKAIGADQKLSELLRRLDAVPSAKPQQREAVGPNRRTAQNIP